MLSELAREQEPDSSLNFPGSDGSPLVVMSKTTGFSSNTLKNVVDERVHDGHSFGAHTGIWVHLLENLVDVDSVGFTPLALLLLISLGDRLLGLTGLLGGLSGYFGRHDDAYSDVAEQRLINPTRICAFLLSTFARNWLERYQATRLFVSIAGKILLISRVSTQKCH